MISQQTLEEVKSLRQLSKEPLFWVMENCKPLDGDDLLWLEFGVWQGASINYFGQFTRQIVYGFDSFEGLPEKWRTGFGEGHFSMDGKFPNVRDNVTLIKGWFDQSLPVFLADQQNRSISFVHFDADLYSSTAFILSSIAPWLAPEAIFVFDELINYDGFDGDNGELRAWDEFIQEYDVNYSWIGGHGESGDYKTCNEKAAVRIHSVKSKV